MREMIFQLLPEICVPGVTGVTGSKNGNESASFSNSGTGTSVAARDVPSVTAFGAVHSLHSIQNEVYLENTNKISSVTPVTSDTPDFVQDCLNDIEERAAIMEYDAEDIYPSRETATTAAFHDVTRTEDKNDRG